MTKQMQLTKPTTEAHIDEHQEAVIQDLVMEGLLNLLLARWIRKPLGGLRGNRHLLIRGKWCVAKPELR